MDDMGVTPISEPTYVLFSWRKSSPPLICERTWVLFVMVSNGMWCMEMPQQTVDMWAPWGVTMRPLHVQLDNLYN